MNPKPNYRKIALHSSGLKHGKPSGLGKGKEKCIVIFELIKEKIMKNILVLIDIQKEYITPGRPYYLNGIERSLLNCQELLYHARKNKWEIIHVQHSNGEDAPKFNPTTDFFNFVDGFEPQSHEIHVVKNDFSCYSSKEYATYMSEAVRINPMLNIYIAGYNSVMCCQSTLEEARRLKHALHSIADASLAKSLNGRSEEECHQYQLDLYTAKGLAKIIFTKDILR